MTHLAELLRCLAGLALLAACSKAPSAPAERPAQTPEELVRALYASADEVGARPEQPVQEVTFQHLLIGVSGGVEGVTRSPGAAQVLAAELLGRVRAGEDFDLLVKNYTNDVHPGVYTLSMEADDPPRVFARSSFVQGVGDVAWRLEVGEVGVAAYDAPGVPGNAAKSPLGFHLVRRMR